MITSTIILPLLREVPGNFWSVNTFKGLLILSSARLCVRMVEYTVVLDLLREAPEDFDFQTLEQVLFHQV